MTLIPKNPIDFCEMYGIPTEYEYIVSVLIDTSAGNLREYNNA